MINTDLLIENLEELASKDLQERRWVEGGDSCMSSFEEVTCGVFDDAGVSRALDSGYLSRAYPGEFVSKVRTLDELIGRLPANASPEIILNHPLMKDVRSVSAWLLEALKSGNSGDVHM